MLAIAGLDPKTGEEKYMKANKSIDERYEGLVRILKEAREQAKEVNKKAY